MALGECQKMSENVGIWLDTTRQISASVGVLYYTEFAGDPSGITGKLEGGHPGSVRKLDLTSWI